jgi:hypothetical protein
LSNIDLSTEQINSEFICEHHYISVQVELVLEELSAVDSHDLPAYPPLLSQLTSLRRVLGMLLQEEGSYWLFNPWDQLSLERDEDEEKETPTSYSLTEQVHCYPSMSG